MEGFSLLSPSWLNWCALGILLMILEIATPGVMLIWFGLGALLCALISWAFGIEAWQIQALIFCVLSVISVFVGRKFIRKAAPQSNALNNRLQRYVGKKAALETALKNGHGRVKLDDTYWIVTGPDLPAGAEVTVVRVEDGSLVVEPATSSSTGTF